MLVATPGFHWIIRCVQSARMSIAGESIGGQYRLLREIRPGVAERCFRALLPRTVLFGALGGRWSKSWAIICSSLGLSNFRWMLWYRTVMVSTNRDRLIGGALASKMLSAALSHEQATALPWDEYFLLTALR
jgi:hypothetical protein